MYSNHKGPDVGTGGSRGEGGEKSQPKSKKKKKGGPLRQREKKKRGKGPSFNSAFRFIRTCRDRGGAIASNLG